MLDIIFEDCSGSYRPGLTRHAKQCPLTRADWMWRTWSGVNGASAATIVWETVHCSMGLCQLTKAVALHCVGILFRSLVLDSFVTTADPQLHPTTPISPPPPSYPLPCLNSPGSQPECPPHRVHRLFIPHCQGQGFRLCHTGSHSSSTDKQRCCNKSICWREPGHH